MRLIRGFQYYQLVRCYGDVPLVTKALDPAVEEDRKEIFGPRTPRNQVMDYAFEDLDYAVKHIAAQKSKNAFSRDLAAAMMSEALVALPLYVAGIAPVLDVRSLYGLRVAVVVEEVVTARKRSGESAPEIIDVRLHASCRNYSESTHTARPHLFLGRQSRRPLQRRAIGVVPACGRCGHIDVLPRGELVAAASGGLVVVQAGEVEFTGA